MRQQNNRTTGLWDNRTMGLWDNGKTGQQDKKTKKNKRTTGQK